MAITAGEATGAPSQLVSLPVTLDNPIQAEGFSFGLEHNGAIAQLQGVTPSGVVAQANGGTGPEYFEFNVNPGGTSGGTIGCVIDFQLTEQIPPAPDNQICTFDYVLTGPDGSSTDVTFSDNLGTPPVLTLVAVDGAAIFPTQNSGSLMVTGDPPDFLFIRGDANSDGLVDISDVLFLGNWLFGVGADGTCDAAGDTNDNGTLDALVDTVFLAMFLFQSGDPVPAPFPSCGGDPTPDLPCDASACP